MSTIKTFRKTCSDTLEHLVEKRTYFHESEVKTIRTTLEGMQAHEGDARQWLLFARKQVEACLTSWQDHSPNNPNIHLDDFMHHRVQAISRFLQLLESVTEMAEELRNHEQLPFTVRLLKIMLNEFLEGFQLAKDIATHSDIQPHTDADAPFLDPTPTRRYDSERIEGPSTNSERVIEDILREL